MAPSKTNQSLLMELVSGQSSLVTEVRMLNTRLFEQNGVIPNLYQKHEEAMKEIQNAKDKVTDAVNELKNTELKEHDQKIGDLEKKTSLVLWRTALITSVAGSGVGIGVTMLFKKIFKVSV
jgi:hypothetical protein